MTQFLIGAVQRFVLLVLVVAYFSFGGVTAQERLGTVTGQLFDQSGGTLARVTVILRNAATGRVTTVESDGAGRYAAQVEPGRYAVRFEVSGFRPQDVDNVEVQLGRTRNIGATLRLANVSEALDVTVEPRTPLIDMRSTTIAHNVTAEEIDRLPKQRSFQWIALTAPSVNQGDIEGGFQVNGASSAENAFTVDGVNTASLVNGTSRQNTVFEYVQEVQVKTTGIPAEFGGALGGVISAITKSGGNIFTGEAHYYLNGSPLSANPVRRLVLDPADDETVHYIQDNNMPDHRHEFGASLGGPIVKDRIFFFGSFSPRIGTRINTYRFLSGTEEGDIKRTARLLHAFGKLTYGGRRVNAYSSVLATPLSVIGTLPAFNAAGPNSLSSSKAANAANRERGWEQMQVNSTGTVDVIVSSSAYATFRGGIFHDRYSDTGILQVTNYTYRTVASANRGLPATVLGPVGMQNTPRAQIIDFDTTKRSFFNADYYHTLRAAGRHGLKGGFGIQRTVNNVNQAFPGGYVDIFWDSTLNLANHLPDRGMFGYYTVSNRGTIGEAGANVISLYVQDEWQLSAGLTFNLGIRAENEKVPSFRREIQKYALAFGFIEKVAPRIGVSYDLRGNGHVKIYGSYGRYYDWTKYDLPRTLFGGDTWCVYYRSIDDPWAPLAANLTNMPGRELWRGRGNCRDLRVPSFEIIDPNIKPMSQESISAGFNFAINPRTVATVHYVHNDLIRTIEDLGAWVNGNQEYVIANPGEGRAMLTPATFAPLTPPFNTPKAKRTYDALELGISRRMSGRWFGSASLTISRLYGNYAGLASSDEIRTPTTGVSSATAQQQAGSTFRPGGNVNRAWDSDEQMFDAYGNLDVQGRLATDRPVVLKLYGAYNIGRHTQIGAFVYAGSGTPITTCVQTVHQTELFVEGRGDMGRTPFYSKTDLLVSHELPMAGTKRLRLELNVLNLFNQKTARHIFNSLNRGAGVPDAGAAIDLTNVNLNNGYNYRQMIERTSKGQNAYDPRYGMADLFEPGTQGQVSVKFLF